MRYNNRKYASRLEARLKEKDKPISYKIHMLNAAQRRFKLTLPEAYELRDYLLSHIKEATLCKVQEGQHRTYTIEVPKFGLVKFVYNPGSQEIVTVFTKEDSQ